MHEYSYKNVLSSFTLLFLYIALRLSAKTVRITDTVPPVTKNRSSAVVEGPRDANVRWSELVHAVFSVRAKFQLPTFYFDPC